MLFLFAKSIGKIKTVKSKGVGHGHIRVVGDAFSNEMMTADGF